MNIGRFTKNLVSSIADAGEKFLDLGRTRENSIQNLIDLSTDLISHKGVASGLALARQVVNRYEKLTVDEKIVFLKKLSESLSTNIEAVKKAASDFVETPDKSKLALLKSSLSSDLRKLFSRMIMAPDGTRSLVSLREDLLSFLKQNPELHIMDNDLRDLLTAWFNPGFLILKKIDWDTEASILEKIIHYETVHDIENWNDLKKRLAPDRRCFAYFHPSLEDEPLIFVEIALTKGIASSIQSIIEDENTNTGTYDTAVFYSINNCQKGLRKIPLGNFLIKMVVNELAAELPSIKTYTTLSPVTGFADWVKLELKNQKADLHASTGVEILKHLDNENWHRDKDVSDQLRKPLLQLCAHYLVNVKSHDKPLNAVARFHFGNGAQLYGINWMGNSSEHGISDSFGIMVNYLYDPKQIELNHEAYVQKGELAISKSVRGLVG